MHIEVKEEKQPQLMQTVRTLNLNVSQVPEVGEVVKMSCGIRYCGISIFAKTVVFGKKVLQKIYFKNLKEKKFKIKTRKRQALLL